MHTSDVKLVGPLTCASGQKSIVSSTSKNVFALKLNLILMTILVLKGLAKNSAKNYDKHELLG